MSHPDREFKCAACGFKKTEASYNDVSVCTDCNPEPFTDKQVEEYLNSGEGKCPLCKSDDIESSLLEVDGSTAWQDVFCHDCRAEWTDIYELKGIDRR